MTLATRKDGHTLAVMTPDSRAVRDTRDTLLDATLAAVADVGLAKLSLGDVAHRAGVSRQTLYRYFRDRDDLVGAVILREEEAFVAAIGAAVAHHPGFREALEAAIISFLRIAREHPLLDLLVEREPEAIVPFLTTGRHPVAAALRPILEDLAASRLGHLPVSRVRAFSDGVARMLVSYAVSAPAEPIPALAAELSTILALGLDPRSSS